MEVPTDCHEGLLVTKNKELFPRCDIAVSDAVATYCCEPISHNTYTTRRQTLNTCLLLQTWGTHAPPPGEPGGGFSFSCRYLLPWVRLYQRSANGAEVNPSDGSEVRHGCQNHKRASPKKQDPGIQGDRFPKAQGSPGTLPRDFS